MTRNSLQILPIRLTKQVSKPKPNNRVSYVRDEWNLAKIADDLDHCAPEPMPWDYMKINPVWKFHKVTLDEDTGELWVIYDLHYIERMSNFRVVWSHLYYHRPGAGLDFVKAHPPRYYPARR